MLIRRLLGAPWLIAAAASLVILLVAASAVAIRTVTSSTVTYCAVMNDAVGLFTGNDVTRRGVKIGSITGIHPDGGTAIVRFSVDADQKLPATVGAVSVAPSVLSVRQLSLIGDYPGGPALAPSRCIPLANTKTPVTIARSLESVSQVAAQLTTGGGPAEFTQVVASLQTLDRELGGTGPLIHSLITQLGAQADASFVSGLAEVGRLVDNTSSLVGGVADNFPLLTRLSAQGALFSSGLVPLFGEIERILHALPDTIRVVGSVLGRYQQFVFPGAQAVVPVARLIGAGFRNFGDLLGVVPPLIRAFTVTTDNRSFGVRVTYTPPATTIPATNPTLTCANINRIAPRQCSVVDAHTIRVDLISGVLRGIGAGR